MRPRKFADAVLLKVYLERGERDALLGIVKNLGSTVTAYVRYLIVCDLNADRLDPHEATIAEQIRGRKYAQTHLQAPSRTATHDLAQPAPGHRESATDARELAAPPDARATDSGGQQATHTAASHRLTCMCPSCVDYRHKNQIPVGGLPKKAKRWTGSFKRPV
jgi:hypothetical protein